MALAVEWLPEEWPEGIPNLKQLLVVAPLTSSILLLFGCGNRNLRTACLILDAWWSLVAAALGRRHLLCLCRGAAPLCPTRRHSFQPDLPGSAAKRVWSRGQRALKKDPLFCQR